MADVNQSASAAVARFPLHTFKMPPDKYEKDKDGKDILVYKGPRELDTDPTEIVLRQLTFGEEQQALEAAAAKKTSFVYEGAMRSIVKADGKEISWADNGKENFFGGLSNQVRDLIVRAFSKISLPAPQAVDDFFASEKTTPA